MDFSATVECLLVGPTFKSIITMMNNHYLEQPTIKVDVDDWEDVVAFYKSPRVNFSSQIRVKLKDQLAIDAGGVRAQLYTTVYDMFSQNKKVTLFEGSPRRLRPNCTAEARSSGLFKVLGMMIGHSIKQDGIGFPYLAGVCFWYIAG